jgi:hypothetical protein
MMKIDIRIIRLATILLMATIAVTTVAAPILNTENPVCFFNNVASRLLSKELNINLAQIEIYPTNQYTPAVHRLLQVSANIYDATTTNFYPTVFRPLFSKDASGNVFITGYTNLNSPSGPNTVSGPGDLQLSMPFDVATISALPSTNVASDVNIYGVPWIVGAKKGFPNFNEFSMENNLAVTRRLQLTRITNSSPSVPPTITGTNQMYLMNLNSSLGVELWNSYSSNYPGTILIGLNENASLTITNDDHGQNLLLSKTFSTNALFSINSWPGAAPWYAGNPNAASFLIPLNVSALMLTNSVYRSSYASGAALGTPAISPPGFVPTNNFAGFVQFETNSPNGFYLPQFGVLMTNQLQVFMLDLTNGVYHVIDYVHFAGPDSSFNVNANLADVDGVNNVGVWNTNYPPGSGALPTAPTFGILNQIAYSKNSAPPVEDGLWSSDPGALPSGTIAQQQAFFTAFFIPGNHFGNTTNLLLSVVAPYSPTRYIVQYLTWQANDPLVHYLASDIDSPSPNISTTPQPGVSHYNAGQAVSGLTNLNLGFLNDRYMPWGGNPILAANGQATQYDANLYNMAERDPLVSSSDDWNFPVGQSLGSSWIGQVHRGTPWQTIYLKSTDILAADDGLSTWITWTGDSDATDAAAMSPMQDWRLASLLASLFNTNNFTSLFRVNNPNPNAWQGLLNGLTALTNIPDEFDSVLISSNSSQASAIANAIQSERAVQPRQIFSDVGDILATPQLAEQSPFLTGVDTNIISDANYEIIPSQLLSLLRADSTGSIGLMNSQPVVQFTGYDGHPYAIQTSSDLVNWVSISTNYPVNGVFSFTNSTTLNTNQQFYRSVLLQ